MEKNIIDITEILNDLEVLNSIEQRFLSSFISGIEEYSTLLLSQDSMIDKLSQSLNSIAQVKPLFLNRLLFLKEEELTEKDKITRNILLKLNYSTDEYFDLIDKKIAKKDLEDKIKYYKKIIFDLLNEYKDVVKTNNRSAVITNFRSSKK